MKLAENGLGKRLLGFLLVPYVRQDGIVNGHVFKGVPDCIFV